MLWVLVPFIIVTTTINVVIKKVVLLCLLS
jgi:hypothetical protein